eukprot:2710530-Pleurochrysis_carterae.AAC.1
MEGQDGRTGWKQRRGKRRGQQRGHWRRRWRGRQARGRGRSVRNGGDVDRGRTVECRSAESLIFPR